MAVVNEVVLYSLIISLGIMIFLSFKAHQEQRGLQEKVKGIRERLGKLSKLVEEVEKVQKQMHTAAVEKVDKRNLDMIIRETLEFISEKEKALVLAR